MKRGVSIFLIFVSLLLIVSAKEITFDYPDEVECMEEFEINLELIDFPDENYDVKIEFNEKGTNFAEILNNGKWQSTYYYVQNAIEKGENDAEFKLRIKEEYKGNEELVVKVRKNSGSSFTKFGGYEIEIKCDEQDSENNEDKGTEEQEENSNGNIENITEENNLEESDKETLVSDNSVIKLTPKNIKSTDNAEVIYKSTNQKIKEYAIYGFALFCVVLIVLLAREKLQYG